MANSASSEECPICNKSFPSITIENHVNKCLFLHSFDSEEKPPPKKLSLSPVVKHSGPSPSPMKKQKLGAVKTVDHSFTIPLAKQVEPKNLTDFIGQNHVFGENSVLHKLFENKEIPNMILWGPPGCGKTSLSRVVQEICRSDPAKFTFVTLCAADTGVKEVQNVINIAKNDLKFNRRTILFMDEIHRFNKKQQDTFLSPVEKGLITLIGATTENPSFSINNALLSRCRVIVFEKLAVEAIEKILERAISMFDVKLVEENEVLEECSGSSCVTKGALNWIADTCDGDARIALSNLQLMLQHNLHTNTVLTIDEAKETIKKSHLLYDKKGEEHYNLISAMHKSIRASDVNAAVYWTTRMIVSGEDPMYVARRLVRAASEDIGNADPNALQVAVSTMQGCHMLGMPDCDVLLVQCAVYLAKAPKSRQAEDVMNAAKALISQHRGPQPSVPMHLRNAPTRLMKDLGYGSKRNGASNMPAGLEATNFFV